MSDRPDLLRVADESVYWPTIQQEINLGRLVPVERCEHGHIDEHPIDLTTDEWCPGSPTLTKEIT